MRLRCLSTCTNLILKIVLSNNLLVLFGKENNDIFGSQIEI